ncbi:hypothetical protein ACH5RR_035541 [Cinchona calisaya]|uniref:KIB1-4 beta-propeller domain-containing protein n=1 Tax=Cinchona calisaya TaxID=153742 RepID=A0ABD2Y5E2_9GENT
MVITAKTLLLCPQLCCGSSNWRGRGRNFQTAAKLLSSNSICTRGQSFHAISSAQVREGSSIAAGCSSSKWPFFGPHLFIPSKIYTTNNDRGDDDETEIDDNDNDFDGCSLHRCLNGWLAFFNLRDGGSIYLVNPFTGSSNDNTKKFPVVPFLSLPSFETLPFIEALRTRSSDSSSSSPLFSEFIGLNHRNPKTCLQKLVLSSAPSLPIHPFNNKHQNQEDDCIAVVIGGDKNELACCRVGETSWFGFCGGETTKLGPYTDIIYSSKEGLFYALRGGEFYSPKDGRFRLMRGPDRDVGYEEIFGDFTGTNNSIPPITTDYDYQLAYTESAISIEAWDLSSRGPFSSEKKF